ncbi:DUF1572 family protein [Robertkochia flava]|uniref:DUF1572 family protein n=1 Tax=Robertkochia flava TaxID=3447986 RepID=UPI001CCF40DB|nr:DUF1572 family protein [Robertkochia marina]
MSTSYLRSVTERFHFYKDLGNKTLEQIPEGKMNWSFNTESLNMNLLVKHLAGNMLSRFSEFLTTDGEKPWRNRDAEFIDDLANKEEVLALWEKGWRCLFQALADLTENDADRIVYIRAEAHTVMEALNRQLGHYAYHVGQMVFLGKMICGEQWKSLSIPKGQSEAFNQRMTSGGREK